MRPTLALAATALLLASCQSGDGSPGSQPTGVFAEIGEEETIYLTGTEPFWGGEIASGSALYSTPEVPDGTRFDVERFAGNNGLGFTGTLDGAGFDLTITPGSCSDAMSDRVYPYTATLLIAEEQREGCAWTDAQPFEGLENP